VNDALLYDLGGRTIWAPAIVHAVMQGGIKVVEIPEDRVLTVATLSMAAGMILPWLVFAARSENAPE
jgi:hypothetical protein